MAMARNVVVGYDVQAYHIDTDPALVTSARVALRVDKVEVDVAERRELSRTPLEIALDRDIWVLTPGDLLSLLHPNGAVPVDVDELDAMISTVKDEYDCWPELWWTMATVYVYEVAQLRDWRELVDQELKEATGEDLMDFVDEEVTVASILERELGEKGMELLLEAPRPVKEMPLREWVYEAPVAGR